MPLYHQEEVHLGYWGLHYGFFQVFFYFSAYAESLYAWTKQNPINVYHVQRQFTLTILYENEKKIGGINGGIEGIQYILVDILPPFACLSVFLG